MLVIIEWLKKIESQAAELYHAAADYFSSDSAFSGFLKSLAEEEEWHCQLVASVMADSKGEIEDPSLVLLDLATLENISRLFTRAGERIARDEMTRREMFETIAATEFSEWNDLFLYALHALRGRSVRFQAAVAEIERHKEEIAAFFAADPEGKPFLESLWTLPATAEKRILVIEQNQDLALFLRSILAPLGEVELAETGPEGLSMVEKGRFDVIVSDTDMPAMEIYEFYQRVINMEPQMKDRFLFFSGSVRQEGREDPPDEASWLSKPALISHIRQAVSDIANRNRILH